MLIFVYVPISVFGNSDTIASRRIYPNTKLKSTLPLYVLVFWYLHVHIRTVTETTDMYGCVRNFKFWSTFTLPKVYYFWRNFYQSFDSYYTTIVVITFKQKAHSCFVKMTENIERWYNEFQQYSNCQVILLNLLFNAV